MVIRAVLGTMKDNVSMGGEAAMGQRILRLGEMDAHMMSSSCYKKVFDALRTRRMDELARAAYEILHMPVVVTDGAFIVRAKYPDEPLDDEQWDANVVNRQIEPRFVKTFTDDRHFERHDQAGKAILTDWGHYAQAPRLTQVMRASGTVIGYFAALTTGSEVRKWHYEATDIITEAFAMMMEADAGAKMARAEMSSPVLYALLDGTIDLHDDLSTLPDDFIDENAPPFMLLCVKPRNPHNAPLEVYLGNALARYFEHSVQTVYDGCLYILASNVSHDARGSVRGTMLEEELKRQELDCGTSRMFDSLNEIDERSWEASRALSMGALLNPSEALHHYEDYIADIALDALVANVPRNALEHSALATIIRHDRENNTEYFKTLKTYFECRFDKKRASERLHVHRNTLQYRLDRIAEIQQLSFDEPYLALYFAIEDHLDKVSDAESAHRRGGR